MLRGDSEQEGIAVVSIKKGIKVNCSSMFVRVSNIFFQLLIALFLDTVDHWIQESLITKIVRNYGFDPDEYTLVTNNSGKLEIVLRAQTTETYTAVSDFNAKQ